AFSRRLGQRIAILLAPLRTTSVGGRNEATAVVRRGGRGRGGWNVGMLDTPVGHAQSSPRCGRAVHHGGAENVQPSGWHEERVEAAGDWRRAERSNSAEDGEADNTDSAWPCGGSHALPPHARKLSIAEPMPVP
ncbi:unnamed protein product, partial [Prorocentrum cordatum]